MSSTNDNSPRVAVWELELPSEKVTAVGAPVGALLGDSRDEFPRDLAALADRLDFRKLRILRTLCEQTARDGQPRSATHLALTEDGIRQPLVTDVQRLDDGRVLGVTRERPSAAPTTQAIGPPQVGRVDVGMEQILREAAEGISVTDISGRRVFVNSTAATLMGYRDSDEAQGAMLDDLAERLEPLGDEGSAVLPSEPAKEVLRGRTAAAALYHYRVKKTGEEIDARVRATSVRDPEGNLRYAVTMWTDLTALKQVERELRLQKTLLQAQTEASLEGILVVNPGGKIISSNQRFAELWGLPKELLENESDREALAYIGARLKHPEEFYARVRFLYEHPEARSVDEVELADGRNFLRHSRPLTAWDGTLLGRIWFFRDVTQEKEHERRERMFLLEHTARALAESSSRRASFLADASSILSSSLDHHETIGRVARLIVPYLADWCTIDLVEPDGSVHRAAAAHADPLREEEVSMLREISVDVGAADGVGRVIRQGEIDLHPEVTVSELRGAAEWAPAGATRPEHLEVVRQLGMRSALTVPLLAHRRTLGALTLVLSHEGRRYGQIELEIARDLASRVATAIENAQLYQHSQAAVIARDEFLSIAAHELRTPLTAFDLALRSLQFVGRKLSFGPYEKQARDALEAAERQSKRMEKLVESLLDIALLHSGRSELALERLDLATVAEAVAEEFEEDIARTGGTLTLDLDRPLLGRWDRSLLEQIVGNLLSNACKYGAGKPISVRTHGAPGLALLEVEDRGIGIPADLQERIFDQFERGAAGQHYGGLGLGLYIVRRAVERLGGSISVKSAVGEGSTFQVALPREPAVAMAESEGERDRWAGEQ